MSSILNNIQKFTTILRIRKIDFQSKVNVTIQPMQNQSIDIDFNAIDQRKNQQVEKEKTKSIANNLIKSM